MSNARAWTEWLSILETWEAAPALLEEDGSRAPRPDVFFFAKECIVKAARLALPPPSRITPDGEGGLVFDTRGPRAQAVELIFTPQGAFVLAELRRFDGARLVYREVCILRQSPA